MTTADNREDGGKLIFQASITYWSKMGESLLVTEWKKLPEFEKEAYRSIWDEITAPYHTLLNNIMQQRDSLLKKVSKLERGNEDILLDYQKNINAINEKLMQLEEIYRRAGLLVE